MWSVKLSDSQRDALSALVKAQGERGPALAGALEALELARWDDLPDATLPWDRVAELAERAGHRRGRRGLGPDRPGCSRAGAKRWCAAGAAHERARPGR